MRETLEEGELHPAFEIGEHDLKALVGAGDHQSRQQPAKQHRLTPAGHAPHQKMRQVREVHHQLAFAGDCPFRRIREVIPLNPGTSWSEVA